MDHSDEHIIEAIGKTRVIIRNGKVVDVSEPLILECPLARKFSSPVLKATPEAIRANIEDRIHRFGMCTGERQVLADRDFVMFGASELISAGLTRGFLDCAVIVCDGAGTVLAQNPLLVQGIGGRMSGLVKTSPIPEVIARIENNGGKVLDHESASIDQIRGTEMAYAAGHSKIAVTVASPDTAAEIRERYRDALIIGVHLTGVTDEEARRLVSTCDIVSSCASRSIREHAGRKALLQGGVSIPVFALTGSGKELVLEKIRSSGQPVVIRAMNLPYSGENVPNPLI